MSSWGPSDLVVTWTFLVLRPSGSMVPVVFQSIRLRHDSKELSKHILSALVACIVATLLPMRPFSHVTSPFLGPRDIMVLCPMRNKPPEGPARARR